MRKARCNYLQRAFRIYDAVKLSFMSHTPHFTVALPAPDALDLSPRAAESAPFDNGDALPTGTKLDDDFTIVGVLGRGGFGITYDAVQNNGRSVAIKEWFPLGCARDSDGSVRVGGLLSEESFACAKRQFEEGARVLETFRHPTLARVYRHFGAHGTAYLVMERLHGCTLQELIETHGALSENKVRPIIGALSEALDVMHRLQFLHLDIKPENIMLCPSQKPTASTCSTHEDKNDSASTCSGLLSDENARIVLFDFDLMQRIESTGGLGTRPLTAQCGTPGYAPLEQYAQHEQLDERADLYALGATTFYLLTAQTPLSATDRALHPAPLSPREWKAELSREIDEAVMWATQISPPNRPPDVENWRDALRDGHAPSDAPAIEKAPVAADDDDNAFLFNAPLAPTAYNVAGAPVLPIVPQFAKLPLVDGWYQIAAKTLDVSWPPQCACCGRSPDQMVNVKANNVKWAVPYCRRCATHGRVSRQAVVGATLGMASGLLIAGMGWLLSDLWISPAGVAVHFSAMAYGALKFQASEAIMRPRCCDRNPAITFGGERLQRGGEKRYLVRFRNMEYADAWKTRNVGKY